MAKKRAARAPKGTGSIRTLKNGKYEARYYDRDGSQKSKTCETNAEAREYLTCKLLEVQIAKHNLSPHAILSMTVSAWMEMWRDCYTSHLKPNSRRKVDEHIRNSIDPYVGHIPIRDLTPADVQKMLNRLARDRSLSPKSIKNALSTLHSALDYLVRDKTLPQNPSNYGRHTNLQIPATRQAGKKQQIIVTDQYRDDFCSLVTEDPYRDPIEMAYYAGLRLSEVLGLTWGDVDFPNNTMRVWRQHYYDSDRKVYVFASLKQEHANDDQSRERILRLGSQARDILLRCKQQQQHNAKALGNAYSNPDGFVFSNAFGGHLCNNTVSRHVSRIGQTIGLSGLRYHDLRHTFAVNFLRAGGNIKTLQYYLGHHSAAFTLKMYAHYTIDMADETAAVLAAMPGAVPETITPAALPAPAEIP